VHGKGQWRQEVASILLDYWQTPGSPSKGPSEAMVQRWITMLSSKQDEIIELMRRSGFKDSTITLTQRRMNEILALLHNPEELKKLISARSMEWESLLPDDWENKK
jgi:hypothetical protein